MTLSDFKRDLLLQRGDLLAQRRNLDDNLAKIEGALMAMEALEKGQKETTQPMPPHEPVPQP